MGFSRTYSTPAAAGTSEVIKNVQEITGQITTSVLNVAITSVNTSFTILHGTRIGGLTNSDDRIASTFVLTSPTNVQFQRGAFNGTGSIYKLFVEEYNPAAVRSIQTGEIAVSANSVNAVITSVVVAKSTIYDGGFRDLSGTVVQNLGVNMAFNSPTSIVVNMTSAADHKVKYQILSLV